MPDVGFTIGGDNSQFLAAIKDSQSAVAQASAAIRDSLKGMTGGFHQVTEEVQGVGESLESIQGKIQGVFEFTGVAAAAEIINKVGESIEQMAAHVRQISTDSQLLGITVEQFQAIQHAGEEAGVGTETLTRAGERLVVMLEEARNGSSSAIDKLLTLGVTTKEINDPLFGINDLFGILRQRLESGGTAQETMNALLQVLGNRAASAAVALKEYDGSAAGVEKTMQSLNGLTAEQIDRLKELGSFWGNLGTFVSNTGSKIRLLFDDMAKGPGVDTVMNDSLAQQPAAEAAPTTGPSLGATQAATKARENMAEEEAQNYAVIQQKILEEGLKNIQFGLAAFKEGTAARLEALKNYAAAAAVLYGQDAPVTQQANEKVLAAQLSYNERQKAGIQELTDFGKQMDNELQISHARLRQEMAKADAAYVVEARKFQEQLNELTEAGAAVSQNVAKLQAEQAKQIEGYNKQVRADFEKQYKGIETSITNSLSGALTNMLTKTKSWRQEMASIFESLVGAIIKHFVQMGVQWAEVQLENLILSKLTAKGQVQASAGAAGAAGTASFAGAPWPVDLGAPAFGAGMAAAAASFAVAERGFDVPAGINPLTQLHAREMVLPAALADTVRSRMATGGMGGGEQHHYYSGDVNIAHQDLRAMVGSRAAQRELIKTIATGLRRGARPR